MFDGINVGDRIKITSFELKAFGMNKDIVLKRGHRIEILPPPVAVPWDIRRTPQRIRQPSAEQTRRPHPARQGEDLLDEAPNQLIRCRTSSMSFKAALQATLPMAGSTEAMPPPQLASRRVRKSLSLRRWWNWKEHQTLRHSLSTINHKRQACLVYLYPYQ